MEKRYYSLSDHLKETYGKRLYKISLDADFTCPNRDGTKGTGGCIFCSGSGSGEFAEKGKSITRMIDEAKMRYFENKKIPSDSEFIAYFQSFSGTYGSIDHLRSLYYEAISCKNIRVLSIGTRPDCIDDNVISLLTEINEKVDVWIEFGLQTSNDLTAERINRCYKAEVYEKAVKKLKEAGIKIITHLILGLPGETHEDEISSLRFAAKCGTDGVKFHLLYVLKNTPLAETDYSPLSFEEYVDRVCDLIRFLPEKTVIHRLTGDPDKTQVIKPTWCKNKIEVLNAINKTLDEKNIFQGEKSSL